jgi:hypothetical protein
MQDDGIAQPQEEARFLDVLARLKQRDAALYAGSAPLFPETNEGAGGEADAPGGPRAKRQRVMSLAAVNAQQARPARAWRRRRRRLRRVCTEVAFRK